MFLIAFVLALAVPPADIANAVRELGDDDYATRERATKFLWSVGTEAEPALREAMKSRDAEVVSRARDLLDKIPYGIAPNTPSKLIVLIARARAANATSWSEIVGELFDDGFEGVVIARQLADKQLNPARRKAFHREIDKLAWRAAPRLIAAGDLDRADELLKRSATWHAASGAPDANVLRSYAIFVRIRGQLDPEIAAWKRALAGPTGSEGFLDNDQPDAVAAKAVLAFLLKAKGDSAAARPLLEALGDANWQEAARIDAAAWSDLIDLTPPNRSADAVLLAGLRMMYANLAANADAVTTTRDEFAKAVVEAKGNAISEWLAFRTLLFDRRPADALTFAGNAKSGYVAVARAEIMGQRGMLAEALKTLDPTALAPDFRILADTGRARLLYAAGDTKGLDALIAESRTGHVNVGRKQRFGSFDEQSYGLDWMEQLLAWGKDGPAREVAASLLADGHAPIEVFKILTPATPAAALAWHQYFRHAHPADSQVATLDRLPAMLDARLNREQLAAALLWARTGPATETDLVRRTEMLVGFGEACQAAGLTKEAIALYGETKSFVRIGDHHAETGRWSEAYTAYADGIKTAPLTPLPLWLAGLAKEKAGDVPGGRELRMRASALIGSNDELRAKFIEDLGKRTALAPEVRQAIRAERQLIIDTAPVGINQNRNAQSMHCADAGAYADSLTAAAANQRFLILMQRTRAYFKRNDSYLLVLHRLSAERAKGLLAKGDLAGAMAAAEEAHAIWRTTVALAVDLVPALMAKGHRAEADGFYTKVAAAVEEQLKQFPASPTYGANRAWLAACCGRDLDRALTLAESVVERYPRSVPAHEALAEVQLRRREFAAAKATLARALVLQPKSEYLAKLVKRIAAVEAGDANAAIPER